MKLILDPGHGPGEAHRRGGLLFCEGDQNYLLAEEIQRQARRRKIPCQMTRGKTEDPSLEQRASYGKKDTLFLSLHSNACSDPSVRGTEVYDSLSSPNPILGSQLSHVIAKTLTTKDRGLRYRLYSYEHEYKILKSPARGLDYYGVLRHNEAPIAFLLEIGYHTNMEDARAIMAKTKEVANAILTVLYGQEKKGLYRLQVGAYHHRSNTLLMQKRLGQMGISSYLYQDK